MKRFLIAVDRTFKALGVDLRGLAGLLGILAAGCCLVAAMTIWDGLRAILETVSIGMGLLAAIVFLIVIVWMFVEEFKAQYENLDE